MREGVGGREEVKKMEDVRRKMERKEWVAKETRRKRER